MLASLAWLALATVATAWALAPTHRRLVVLIADAFGYWAAWEVLADWYFPESHPLAYQTSRLPLVTTLASGLVCVFKLWTSARRYPLNT